MRVAEGWAAQSLVQAISPRRIAAFDVRAATAYPRIVLRARRRGYPVAVADAEIAAADVQIVASVRCRDVAPFHAPGLRVLNPWTERAEISQDLR